MPVHSWSKVMVMYDLRAILFSIIKLNQLVAQLSIQAIIVQVLEMVMMSPLFFLLDKVPAEIKRIVFTVTIHDADVRKQNFGQVLSAYVRIVNKDSNNEVTRYDLSEDASVETAMIFGEIYNHNGECKFKAVGQGFSGGLGDLARSFGINV
jgi:hypothetical protein